MPEQTPARIRLKNPGQRVRWRDFPIADGDRICVVMVAYDLDYNGPQEPHRRLAPKRREDHMVEFFRNVPDAAALPHGPAAGPERSLAALLEYDPSENRPFDLLPEMGSEIDPRAMTEILHWLEDQIEAWEPIARIEPTPERLLSARSRLAEHGFTLIKHAWAGPHLYEIHYPASGQPIVCGYRNPMNIDDVERFIVTYAPRRAEWLRVVPGSDDRGS